jgi:hypothetical protein
MNFTITNDTVTVFVQGEPHSVTKGAPNYISLRSALLEERWDDVPKYLTVVQAIETWAASETKQTVTVTEEKVVVDGKAMPPELNDRILKAVSLG